MVDGWNSLPTTSDETLKNKTITAPILDSYEEYNVITIPSDPASAKVRVYAKAIDANNDGLFIKIKKAGAVVEVQIA